MRKLYRVCCEVNNSYDEIREVIIVSGKIANAIRRAIRQLKDDGYFDIRLISCSEVQ